MKSISPETEHEYVTETRRNEPKRDFKTPIHDMDHGLDPMVSDVVKKYKEAQAVRMDFEFASQHHITLSSAPTKPLRFNSAWCSKSPLLITFLPLSITIAVQGQYNDVL